jgi:hypothetical protein
MKKHQPLAWVLAFAGLAWAAPAVAQTTTGTAQTPQASAGAPQASAPGSRHTGRRRHVRRTPEERFKRRDRNGDGKLSRDEWPRRRSFDRLDLNGDGVLSADELSQARARKHRR